MSGGGPQPKGGIVEFVVAAAAPPAGLGGMVVVELSLVALLLLGMGPGAGGMVGLGGCWSIIGWEC